MEAIIVETLLPDPLQNHQSHHENAFETHPRCARVDALVATSSSSGPVV